MNTAQATKTTTTVASLVKLYVTKDYDTFKVLNGNRPLDKAHVHRLKTKIEENGNLTPEFPINLNEHMQVVDGQHRIEALKELDMPVYYTVTEGASLATVRQINVGRKNWSWLDYANSYAQDGNQHYKDLIGFYEGFGYGSHILIPYASARTRSTYDFQNGDFKILDRSYAFKMLTQLREIDDVLKIHMTSSLAKALYDIMNNKDYDHPRMVEKLSKTKNLQEWRRKKDWMRNLEDIYNSGYSASSQTRFF